MITLRQIDDSDPMEFEVAISEGGSETRHRVTLSTADYRRLASQGCSPAQCVEAAFRFLLDREPKESILRRFDITLISRYFPEFAARLPQYLASTGA